MRCQGLKPESRLLHYRENGVSEVRDKVHERYALP